MQTGDADGCISSGLHVSARFIVIISNRMNFPSLLLAATILASPLAAIMAAPAVA
jgi:hypothetical protein